MAFIQNVKIAVQITKNQRGRFKLACLELGTTMSDVLRYAVCDTINRAIAQRADCQKGDGDEH